MDPLSITASIIAILQLSTKVLEYLNNVKDGPKDRAQWAIETLNLYNLLFSLRIRLEEGDSEKPWYAAVQALAVKNGPLDQLKQALEALQMKMADGSRLKKASEVVMWKFKKEEVASILDRMERLKSLVAIALEMDHFKLSQAIKDDTSLVRIHVDDTKHRRLLEWISHTDYPAQQSDIIKRRQAGTGQWFLDAPQVVKWLSEPKGTLFCPGIPGAGKTMVAAIAIDHLLKSAQNSVCGVAYVYCNYKTRGDQDASSMLSAILKQLVQAQPSIMEPVEQLHKQHAKQGTRPSLEDITDTLQNVLQHFSTIYLVVDALDECKDGTCYKFLAELQDLQTEQDIRLMATSRLIPDIVYAFRGTPRIEIQASQEDVKCFVAGQTHRLPRCIQRDSELQTIVQEKIVDAVDGMFLLARLHTDSLLDKRTPKDVKLTLAKLSKGSAALDDAYKDALQRINGQLDGDSELAKKVLSWITFAKRPLTMAEICRALAVEIGKSELDLENIPDVEDLVSVCAGLVVVDPESAIIRLVHYTTQEYFERTRGAWNPTAQVDITLTCLTYLSFNVFKGGSCSSDEEFEKRRQEFAFLDYAAKYWGEHATTVEGEFEVCELICSFLSHESLVLCTAQVSSVQGYTYSDYSQHYAKSTTGLHLAAQFGLPIVLEAILPIQTKELATALEKTDSNGHTPLHLAAEHGHHKVVKLLLDKGANVNAQEGKYRDYGNALYAASAEGYDQIVKLLLDMDADVNAHGGPCDTPLQAASAGGYERVVKLLLAEGANVNARGGRYGNALQAASQGGNEQVVKLLLDEGADVNAQGGEYRNALFAASTEENEQVMKLLLDEVANVNTRHGRNGNALYAASAEGHAQVVKLLLDNGANVNVQGGEYGNPLQAASSIGSEQVVKLLLDKGADVNAQGGWHGNALQAASVGFSKGAALRLYISMQGGKISEDSWIIGYEKIFKMLLDMGASVNAQGGWYGNALQAASEGGSEQVVQILLDKGAEVNAQGGEYGNALNAASVGGYEEIVVLLLNNQANVNAEGGKYGHALQAASRKGHEQIVKFLLEKGAEVNAQGGRYGNALQAASKNGSEWLVMLLLDRDADINMQGGLYGNALQAASQGGHEQIVELLLDKGAELNTQGGEYGNALQAASVEGHKHVVKLLLDEGADVNICGGLYNTALQAASSCGHEQVVGLLLNGGADVNAQSSQNDNALYAASVNGYEQIVKLLLDKGAKVNNKSGEYGNALQAASQGGHKQVVERLIEKNAEVNAQGGFYGNALYAASVKGYEQVVELLLEKGANVNAAGGECGNALQAASVEGYEQVVKLLLSKGADVGLYGNALQAASYRGSEQVVRQLLNKGAKVNAEGGKYSNALCAALHKSHAQVMKLLLEKGAKFDAKSRENGRALCLAADKGHEQVVRILLDAGVAVDERGELYDTALQAASSSGHEQVISLLLDRGADVNAPGGDYGNALYAASSRGHKQVAKLLLDEGALVNVEGELYGNALHAALWGGHKQVVKLLLNKAVGAVSSS